jgi:pimeloyl-ACP methyl ester carboxylesterase
MTQLLAPRRLDIGAGGSARSRVVTVLDRLGRHRLVAGFVAVVVIGAAAAVTALVMPRGPIVPGQVIVALLSCAGVGAFTGLLLRSRWAILLAPAAYAAVFELVRLDVAGPSVDLPRIDTTIGYLVLVLGRGFAGVLMLLPMAVGAAYGAATARRLWPEATPERRWPWRVASYARQALTALVALALVGLGLLLTRPGGTPPIGGPDGGPLAGSVAELATVRLGGHDQRVLIRGRSTANPVLLYLAGGPGQSDLGYTRAYMPTMENDFVFAVWDQRGTGTSYAALDPTDTLTLDRAVADTIELSVYLRDRFGQDKIYLFGNSWGSTLGVLAVQRRPDLYAAYIGAGQMASQLASDQIIYRDVLDYAARTGDRTLADRMREWGEPPYADIYAYGFLLEYYDKIGPYPRTAYYDSHRPSGLDGNGATEYGPLDKVNKLKALVDMGSVMYPQLQGLDFRRDVPALDVPVYLVMGAHELRARTEPAREWFDLLQAPDKEWITFADSGHVPQFEEFDHFRDVLTGMVLPRTQAHAS